MSKSVQGAKTIGELATFADYRYLLIKHLLIKNYIPIAVIKEKIHKLIVLRITSKLKMKYVRFEST